MTIKRKSLLPRLAFFFFAGSVLSAIVYLNFQAIDEEAPILVKKTAAPTFSLISFEPDERPSRNAGTWVKHNGKIQAKHFSFEGVGTTLRLSYDVLEDGDKAKEAGWWCSLGNMDLRPFTALRFRVALSDPKALFLVGIKSGEWLEQKISSKSFTDPSVSPGQWQEITIPLKAFHHIEEWTGMDNFSVTMRSGVGAIAQGEIFLDDFALIPSLTPFVPKPPRPPLAAYPLPANIAALSDEKLLDIVERSAFDFFLNESNIENGLVKDFCKVWQKDHTPVASSAAVGFALTSYCVGASRGWITDDAAKARILNTLKFYRDKAEQEHGFFYHFLDMDTGERWEESEVSSVDTALLLAGMLMAANYYPDTEIATMAREIYARVDWEWMLDGGRTLSMGWTPEAGFLSARWADYCELMIIYLLAIGSPSHPIPESSWYQWSRLLNQYKDETFIACPPLFTHQYAHIWVDFRGIADEEANYFENSQAATRANQKWCWDRRDKFKTYAEGFWGLTACDGPTGYMAYGAPYGVDDGTVSPTAAIGSIVFTPKASIAQIRLLLEKLPKKVWGRYGFIDAFNLEEEWYSKRYLGIDQGPILLMIENYRTGLVWKTFMQEESIQQALKAVGFVSESKEETSKRPAETPAA